MIVDQPRGVVPRSRGCDLPPNYASIAENINLGLNRFEPWRQPVELVKFPQRTRTAHLRSCCWTGDSDWRTTFRDAGVDRKTYRSSPDCRIMVTDTVCDIDYSYLGYPVPEPVHVFVDPCYEGTKNADTESRTYIITYGTECEEGPASCPSESIDANKDSIIGILLPEPPDPKWGATHVNIYCSRSTWDVTEGLMDLQEGSTPVQPGWTSPLTDQDYFLLATLNISQMQYVHGEHETTERAETRFLLPPPEKAQVAGETKSGSLVIYWDKSVAFSERNKYWGFPLKTYHDFPFPVLDVKVCSDSVYVLTSGGVYFLNDAVDCKESSDRPVLELKGAPVPSTCLSCLEIGEGILYTSPEGIVRLDLDGRDTIISDAAFDKDAWACLGGIRDLELACGVLIVSTEAGEYVWQWRFDESGKLPADVSTLSFFVDDWLTDEQGNLYFIKDDTAFQFNAGADYMQMLWRQAEQRRSIRQRLSSVKAEYVRKGTPVHNVISIYRDKALSASKELTGEGQRIKNSTAQCLQVEIKGSEPMCSIAYGSGLRSLNLRGDPA